MTKKIYLDYQSTTPVASEIFKKMMPYFTENFGNPHSNNHEFGRFANEAVQTARTCIKKRIHLWDAIYNVIMTNDSVYLNT